MLFLDRSPSQTNSPSKMEWQKIISVAKDAINREENSKLAKEAGSIVFHKVPDEDLFLKVISLNGTQIDNDITTSDVILMAQNLEKIIDALSVIEHGDKDSKNLVSRKALNFSIKTLTPEKPYLTAYKFCMKLWADNLSNSPACIITKNLQAISNHLDEKQKNRVAIYIVKNLLQSYPEKMAELEQTDTKDRTIDLMAA